MTLNSDDSENAPSLRQTRLQRPTPKTSHRRRSGTEPPTRLRQMLGKLFRFQNLILLEHRVRMSLIESN